MNYFPANMMRLSGLIESLFNILFANYRKSGFGSSYVFTFLSEFLYYSRT